MWWPLPYLTVCASGSKLTQNDRRRPSSYPVRSARALTATTLAPPRVRPGAPLTCIAVKHPGAPLVPCDTRVTACSAPQSLQTPRRHPLCPTCKPPAVVLRCPASACQTPAGHVRRKACVRPLARANRPHPLSRPAGTAPPWRRRGSAAGPRRAGPRARQSSPRRPPPPPARLGLRLRTFELSQSLAAQALLARWLAPALAMGCTEAESYAGQRNPGVLSKS